MLSSRAVSWGPSLLAFAMDPRDTPGVEAQLGARPVSPLGRQPRVLVVDDDPSLRRLLRLVLGTAGYEIVLSADGEDGLRVVRDWEPDIVVLDLHMPGIDGLEFFQRFRRDRQTPVIILSAHGAREAANQAGADAWMEKPFDPDRLTDLVARLLSGDSGAG